MAKDLKHYQRIHTMNEEGKKSFVYPKTIMS